MRYRFLHHFMLCLMLLAAQPSLAEAKLTKPKLENYSNYNEFLAAMYAYKKQLELEKRFAQSLAVKIELPETTVATGGAVSVMPIKSPELSALEEVYSPPLIVNGPEDLEAAIESAKKFLHPIYTEQLRYNRTTQQSFPLKPLEQPIMAQAVIEDGFKLTFSNDNEQKVDQDLSAVSADKLEKDSKQDQQAEEMYYQRSKHAGTMVGTDVMIMGTDLNSTTVSATLH
ncbi:hypothetical protein [Agitococcus lubricus]|uniref:Uncharacterized protein n=1 Tax=Agitococcus lubricus TaxID=1077255 RepID=A0A2T5J2Z6_9GAMM|nr:hypothetical protein [Agitococcus lubricus]PTQ90990.1 hypothetical protein C8N29_10160 [Agitococcus lubricus]